MKKVSPKLLLCFLLLLTAGYVTAQVKFSASISPAQITKDEFAELKLSVENAKEVKNIIPPQLNNFIIISGPNQESGMSVINGNVKKYVAVNYIIRPKSPGNFTIPSATAIADGGSYQSNAVVLKVTNAISGNHAGTNNAASAFNLGNPFAEPTPSENYPDYILKKGESVADKIKKNMFLKLVTNKASCYVGEPVIAEYKLYTRLKSESSMTKTPSFNGFSVIDMTDAENMFYKREKLNGREYNVYTIRKAQLYPLQPGNPELEVAEVENNVHFIREEYANRQTDIFGDMFNDLDNAGIPAEGMEDHRVVLQSKPMSILVKPLPDVDKPVDFKGAVGNFSIGATVTGNNFTTDDAARLTVTISGVGNIQLVTAPEIKWPAGIESYDPKITDDLVKTTVPVSGKKTIEYTFTAEKPGTFTIPSTNFSFFDPGEGKYKTVSTQPIDVVITKGTGKPDLSIPAENKPASNSLINQFFSSRLRVVSVVAVLIILGLLLWLKLDRKKERIEKEIVKAEEKKSTADEMDEDMIMSPQNPLAPAEESLHRNDGAAFYVVLNQSLKNYLSGKFHIPAEDLNKKTITEQLDRKGVANETSLHLQQLMDEIEWQLYTPAVESEQMHDIYERANGLVQLLNTYKI